MPPRIRPKCAMCQNPHLLIFLNFLQSALHIVYLYRLSSVVIFSSNQWFSRRDERPVSPLASSPKEIRFLITYTLTKLLSIGSWTSFLTSSSKALVSCSSQPHMPKSMSAQHSRPGSPVSFASSHNFPFSEIFTYRIQSSSPTSRPFSS